MFTKLVALPRSVRAYASASEQSPLALRELYQKRNALLRDLAALEFELEEVSLRSVCGSKPVWQDVETYDGSLGVTQEFVRRHERPVGQLQWRSDLHTLFRPPHNFPGFVNDKRWGTGALIAPDLFLTAGHCFASEAAPHAMPTRDDVPISREEAASLMHVNFNYQINGETGETRIADVFPIVRMLENGYPGVDYAILRLGPNEAGRLPGDIYGTLPVAKRDLTTPGAMLCMIQHPLGQTKKIEAGPMLSNSEGFIRYNSLDAENASSGAPVLSDAGEIVGVHIHGGCRLLGGTSNYGQTIGVIRAASRRI